MILLQPTTYFDHIDRLISNVILEFEPIASRNSEQARRERHIQAYNTIHGENWQSALKDVNDAKFYVHFRASHS